jgi:hypothetical protein
LGGTPFRRYAPPTPKKAQALLHPLHLPPQSRQRRLEGVVSNTSTTIFKTERTTVMTADLFYPLDEKDIQDKPTIA